MLKNILIFSDGTGQVGGLRPDQRLSNIYKLYRATRIDPTNMIDPKVQMAYYDPGLGTGEFDGPWWTTPISSARKMYETATGGGISRNIADCYEYLIKNWHPGDRIYLFGFSRGGYTARCLANVIALCGVPTKGANGSPLPIDGQALRKIADEAVTQVYDHRWGAEPRPKDALDATDPDEYKRLLEKHKASKDALADERKELARRFREQYGSNDLADSDQPNASAYFVGVFDSVASLGLSRGHRKLARLLVVAGWAAISLLAGSILGSVADGAIKNATLLCGLVVFLFGISFAYWRYSVKNLKVINDYPIDGQRRSHMASKNFDRAETDAELHPRVGFARHALAIDEFRYDFPRALWGGKATDVEGKVPGLKRFKQVWFAGNHSDIGGSYPEDESRLSDIPLEWMVGKATSLPHPIQIDRAKLNPFPSPLGKQHCEIETQSKWFRFFLPWKRDIRDTASGGKLHYTVRERFAAGLVPHQSEYREYRPKSLLYRPDFSEQCRTAHVGDLPENYAAMCERHAATTEWPDDEPQQKNHSGAEQA